MLLLAFLVWPVEGTMGQVDDHLKSGDRIRLAVRVGDTYSHSLPGSQLGSGDLIRGVYSRVDEGRLSVTDSRGSGVWTIPVTSVESIEVFCGREPLGIRAVWIGALVGGAAGALVVPEVSFHESDACGILGCGSGNGGRLVFAGLGSLAGGLVGGLIGTLVRKDKWYTLNTETFRLTVRSPNPGALTLSFVGER